MEIAPRIKPPALFDLDGTLANYDRALARQMEAMRAPEEKPFRGDMHNLPPHLLERARLIKTQPGFWSGLEEMEAGFAILRAAIAAGFGIHILTQGPEKAPIAWTEKFIWAESHVFTPYKIPCSIDITRDKSRTYGKVLVDDWPDYILAWLSHRPRGRVIMPAQPWNRKFKHPQVLRYDHQRGGAAALLRVRMVFEEVVASFHAGADAA